MSEKRLKLKRTLIKKFSPAIVGFLLKLLHKTIRWQIVGKEHIENIKTPVIFAFFHGRMMMLAQIYKKLRPGKKIKMILSPHFDGEVGALIAKRFGIDHIKGSSSKKSFSLLREIHGITDSDIGITPDGPRGPYQQVKNGIIYIAKTTGFPIVPISYSVKSGRCLKSWDRFLVPMPFTKGVYLIGEPIFIEPDIPKDKIDEYVNLVQTRMIEITKMSDSLAGFKA